jgi:uncharacterized membrane protein YdbT with pleckstrin-like domain
MAETTLYKSHPAMFRNHPVGFILSLILVLAFGLGLIILLIWWIQIKGTTLVVTDERVSLRRGILSRHTNDVYHTDIRNVQISQGFLQRLFDVGSIGVASSGHAGIEIAVNGLPDPLQIKEIIDQYRKQNR